MKLVAKKNHNLRYKFLFTFPNGRERIFYYKNVAIYNLVHLWKDAFKVVLLIRWIWKNKELNILENFIKKR